VVEGLALGVGALGDQDHPDAEAGPLEGVAGHVGLLAGHPRDGHLREHPVEPGPPGDDLPLAWRIADARLIPHVGDEPVKRAQQKRGRW
jgi:hypothetical protein